MISPTPTFYCNIRLDGVDLPVITRLYTNKKTKTYTSRFRIDWTTFRGYKQHAIVDIPLHKIGQICVAQDYLKEYILHLVTARYQSRAELGHGIIDTNLYASVPQTDKGTES